MRNPLLPKIGMTLDVELVRHGTGWARSRLLCRHRLVGGRRGNVVGVTLVVGREIGNRAGRGTFASFGETKLKAEVRSFAACTRGKRVCGGGAERRGQDDDDQDPAESAGGDFGNCSDLWGRLAEAVSEGVGTDWICLRKPGAAGK